MSDIAICTDSSALFPAGVAERLGVTRVPVKIAIDGQAIEVSEDEIDGFYERLSRGTRATTSQPSPADFLAAYASAAARGATEVLSIHLDAQVSGTAASAERAAHEAPIPVTVVDTGTVSFGVGVCVRSAAEAVAAGASAGDAVAAAEGLGSKLRNVFVAAGGPGGRVADVPGWAVLEFAGAKAQPIASCTHPEEAIEVMVAALSVERRPVRAAVGHAAAAIVSEADALASSLAALPQVVEVERYRVGPAVGAHTGPLSFGAFWWPASL